MRQLMIFFVVLGFFISSCLDSLAAEKVKVLFIAGAPSHAPGDHEHRAGCMLLAKKLKEALPNVKTEVVTMGWPKDESVFDGVSAVVVYCDGGKGHLLNRHLIETLLGHPAFTP